VAGHELMFCFWLSLSLYFSTRLCASTSIVLDRDTFRAKAAVSTNKHRENKKKLNQGKRNRKWPDFRLLRRKREWSMKKKKQKDAV
jgi:hypothetical protein